MAYTLSMTDIEAILERCEGFEWDEHNQEKNYWKHGVTLFECEEVFFNEPVMLAADVAHSSTESRYWLLGQTNEGRHLLVVFMTRRSKIRVITARDMTRKEKQRYGQL